ncbi:MAG: hypothetical protein JO047_06965 [Alphaproteobacteria bacterium]|nr:hypothetical protein [Alphaproteobacteria bacterium]
MADFLAGRTARGWVFFLVRSFSFDIRSFRAAADLVVDLAADLRVPAPDLLRPAVALAEDLLRVVTPETSSTGLWRDPECNSAGSKPTGARIAS